MSSHVSEPSTGAEPSRPVVIVRPAPQQVERIFTPEALARLEQTFTVQILDEGDEARFDELLPGAFAVVGQPDLPAARLERAGELRAVLNVEGNFFPNVDYRACFERGIHVLGCGPAYATAVAEYALGLALDLARGISREDRAFRAGEERYVSASTADSILLSGADIGLIGFGNLGRALHRLLAPFGGRVRIFDPWLPDSAILDAHATPATLPELLAESQFIFVLATVTPESQHLLGAEQLAQISDGARLVLVSRAAVVDYGALLERVAAGRILAAVDVWPEEPLAADHPARSLEGLVLSPHRAGGIPQAFFSIGEMVCDDLELIAQGLPPARMQVAAPELVGRYRNRPVT
jgi:phosphoglycerate dehydrogenase-like enzyme